MPNRHRFVARCDDHGVEVKGPVGYLEHRREFHEGIDFTLVWMRRSEIERDEKLAGEGRTTGGEVMRLLRRAFRRAGW